MSEQKLRHRHAVFLPLFLFTLTLSAFPHTVEQAKAKLTSLLGESQFGEPFVLEDGTYGVVQQGGVLSVEKGISLEKGSVVLGKEGLFEVVVGDTALSGLSGSVHIIRGSKNFTVSALTTPVLVRSKTERVLIPVGYQWQHVLGESLPALKDGYREWSDARSFRLLPEHFIRESLTKLQRAEFEGNGSGSILAFGPSSSRMDQFNALTVLMPNEDIWMLASLHPQFRAQAWSLPTGEYSTEAQLVRLIAFPYLDGSSETVEEFAMDRWSESVQEAALSVELPEKFIERFFHTHFPLVAQMRERGYPERADLLATHLRLLLEAWRTELPPELTDILSELQRDQNVTLHPEKPAETVVEKLATPVIVALDPEEVRKRAYSLLQDTAALFTLETTVEPGEGNTARIQDVLFGGTHEDRKVSFTLDVEKKMVSEVELEKKSYPFHLEWSAFLEWMKK